MLEHGLKGHWVLSSAHPCLQLRRLSPGGGRRQSLWERFLTLSATTTGLGCLAPGITVQL